MDANLRCAPATARYELRSKREKYMGQYVMPAADITSGASAQIRVSPTS